MAQGAFLLSARRRSLWLALVLATALAGCRADVEHLQSLVPEGLTVTETLASKARRFDCQRATFLADAAPGALAAWTPLGSMYEQSFLRCVELEEQLRWKQAISRKTALWHVIEPINRANIENRAHIWYDTETGRLQVLTLRDGL